MANLALEKATVLGGLIYFQSVRDKYISVVRSGERIVDDHRSAFQSVEGLISLIIRSDRLVKPEYLMRMIGQQYSVLPPNDTETRKAYAELFAQLDQREMFTEGVCSKLLEEVIQAKAIRELQTQIAQPKTRTVAALQAAYATFNSTIDSIKKDPGNSIRVWHPLKDMKELLVEKPRTPTGVAIIDKILAGGIAVGEHTGILGPSGGGKCCGRGTPILMYSGEIKKVEDVEIDDLIMGPDSTPRRVLELGRGRDVMYKVSPVKGAPYVVNSAHILTLVALAGVIINGKTYAKGDWVDINIEEYIKLSRHKKSVLKGIRVAIDFPEREAPIVDPYFAGVYIGDGNSRWHAALTNTDEIILDYCKKYADFMGWGVTRSMDRACSRLNFIGIDSHTGKLVRDLILELCTDETHAKRIAPCYKYGSRNTRLEVLAGLLDADGYLHHGHYEIATKFEVLANDILFVARSLGFAAYCSKCKKTCTNTGVTSRYYRVTISGNFENLPVKLPRRKCSPRQQCKNVLHTGITIERLGVDDYFGFVLDGDHRFVLGDFTVTHNTILANMLQCNLAVRRFNTLLIQTEQPISGDIAVRMYSYMLGLPKSTFMGKDYKDIDPAIIKRIEELQPVWDRMRCISTADKVARTSKATKEVIDMIEKEVMDTGFKPSFIILDWLGKLVTQFMRCSSSSEQAFCDRAEELKADLNAFGRAHDISIIYLHQTDTLTQHREPAYKPTKNDADHYHAFANDLEACVCLGTATKFDDGLQIAWLGADKARNMQSGKYVMAKVDGAHVRITECEDGEYALNSKGQFQPMRELIGVTTKSAARMGAVYVPPEGSSDAFMTENY